MKTDKNQLDRTDLKILRSLQDNGRMSNVELADIVNLSPAPCLARVRKLEQQGFISGYRAELDALKLGLGLLAYVEITLNRTTPDIFDRFKDAIQKIDEIEDCHMVAGGFDYLLKVRCADMEDYRRILGEKIAAIQGIAQTHTYVVMEQVKTGRSIKI